MISLDYVQGVFESWEGTPDEKVAAWRNERTLNFLPPEPPPPFATELAAAQWVAANCNNPGLPGYEPPASEG